MWGWQGTLYGLAVLAAALGGCGGGSSLRVPPRADAAGDTAGPDASPDGGVVGFLAADIEGKHLTFTAELQALQAAGSFQLFGTSGPTTDESLTVAFHGLGPGTYDCASTADTLNVVRYIGPWPSGTRTSYPSVGAARCTITVEEVGTPTGHFKGTFAADLAGPTGGIELTNGVFDLTRY